MARTRSQAVLIGDKISEQALAATLATKANADAYGRSTHTGTQDSATVLYRGRTLDEVINELYGLIASAGGTPPAPTAPVVSSAPTLSFPGGSGDVGETATITQGAYSSGTVTGRTWQVVVNGAIVSTVSTSTFTIPAGAAVSPRALSVNELAAWSGGAAVVNPSQTYTVNAPGSVPVVSTIPSITGGNLIGATLTGDVGAWSNGPTSYKKQWKKNGANFGALITSSSTTETLDTSSVADGDAIVFNVIATNGAGDSSASNSVGVTMVADTSGVPDPATIRTGKTSTTSVVTATSNSTITGLWIHHSAGHGIVIPNGVHDVTIIDNEIGPIGDTTNTSPGAFHGIRIGAGCYNITITENVIHDTTSAVTAYQSLNPVVMTKNFVYNVRGPFYHGQMVQLESVRGGASPSRISCNIYDGNYGTIRGNEDVINIYDSEGLSTSQPIEISYNRIRGAATFTDPVTGAPDAHRNGSGIMVGDGPGGRYIWAHHNTIVNVQNVGMGIAGGNGITFSNNRIFMSHTRSALGMYVRDNPGNSTPNTHTVLNNRVYCIDNLYQNGVPMHYEDNSGLAAESGNTFGDTTLSVSIFNEDLGQCGASGGGGGSPSTNAPSFVGANSATYGGAATKPAGTTTGDIIFLIGCMHGSGGTITAPAGFSQIGASTSSTTMTAALFQKTAGGAEPADYALTFGDANNVMSAVVYRPDVGPITVDASAVAAYNIAAASPVTLSSPTITTTTGNTRLIHFALVDASVDGPTFSVSGPGGYSLRASRDNGSFHALGVSDVIQVAAGATGVITGSCTLSSGTANSVGFTVAIRG